MKRPKSTAAVVVRGERSDLRGEVRQLALAEVRGKLLLPAVLAADAVLRQRDMEKHHAYERTAARPYMHNVLLQEHGVKRMRVYVQRQWLLQYPDGRVGLFVLSEKGVPPPPLEPTAGSRAIRSSAVRAPWWTVQARGEDAARDD